MAVLSIPVALAIVLHCAPTADPAMLLGIAQESGLDPLTLRDNSSDEVLRGPGVIEAARHLITAGHSVDLGAWQINSRNLPLLGLGVADAFEPCKAAAAAASLIELFSRYNTGSLSRGIANGYARAVLAAIRAVKAAGPVPQRYPPPLNHRRPHLIRSPGRRRSVGISSLQPKGTSSMNWLTIVQNIATFITGQFGIALVTVAIGIFGSPLGDLSSVGQFRGIALPISGR